MKELLKKCGANENYEEKDNLPKNHDGHRVVNDYFDRWVTSFERVIRTRTFKLQLIIRNQKNARRSCSQTGFNCTVHFFIIAVDLDHLPHHQRIFDGRLSAACCPRMVPQRPVLPFHQQF